MAALKTTPTPDLKQQWRDLFDSEPPPYNRRFLESRLAYRVQELAYGGLKPETVKRLEALGGEIDGGNPVMRRIRAGQKPIAGTRLIREWQGIEHAVTVRDDGYEYRGAPYKSLSSIARAITGTRWNGWVFFGLKNSGGRSESGRWFREQRPPQTERIARMKQARSQAKVTPKVRCAVYTRKSSEEGLDMEFNSLDAQREACEAYIASQKPEGWVLVPDRYDDGGVSGGTLERPALKRLLADIERGQVDVVVVYKIDRLSRSLMDFAKLVEVFERRNVTFVSVTQSFNTTTSMGRLTLNILLSFAQFEREVIGERIRDKFAASRKKGMWMGGFVPLGYRVENRKLVIDKEEAATVRMIFERFLKVGSATLVARALNAEGVDDPARQADRQGLSLQAPEQPRVHRRRRPQGHGLSRRARGDHQPRSLEPGSRHPAGEPARPRPPYPHHRTCAPERADLRADRRCHVADISRARADGSIAIM